MGSTRRTITSITLFIAMALPVGAAVMSPLHEWRDAIYIAASFAGIIGMALMLLQPALIAGYLSWISPRRSRRIHQSIGVAIAVLVTLHVAGLWITSPPDVIDALLFVSATPFSNWGVLAMWAIFFSLILTTLRHKISVLARTWKLVHRTLAFIIIVGTVVHAMLIDGAMETISKSVLCLLLLITTVMTLIKLRWR